MNLFKPSQRASAIEKAAADWVTRCDRGLTPAEAEQFARWEDADPRHSEEFSRLLLAWETLGRADEVPEVMRLAREIEETSLVRRFFRHHAPTVAGIGIAAAIAVVAWFAMPQRTEQPPVNAIAGYRVVPSTAQRLTLADGTIVFLNGGSAVEPSFTPEQRRVRLISGEAKFIVAKDAARPFVVEVAGVAVQAVGTVFNIRYEAHAVEVLVTEGKVRVDDSATKRSLLVPATEEENAELPLLTAGNRVRISLDAPAAAAPEVVESSDLERALSWQSTQLVFERTPLIEAVAAFNSFNREQLVIGDPAIASRKLGGTFRADNLDAFVRLLETGFEISAEREGDRDVILRQRK